MIQRLIEDDDGSMALEFDLDGIEYLIDGLEDLSEGPVGTVLTTPSVWTVSSPWWKFWDRSETPVVGEMRLRRVG